MPTRTSKAKWTGTLKTGKGVMEISGIAFKGPFNFASRFQSGKGTNPEELIAAAQAGCFSMALSGGLEQAGYTVNAIESTVGVTVDKVDQGFAITQIDITVEGDVQDIDEVTFTELAEKVKDTCPVSKALEAVPKTVQATLKQ
jgi:osmotically inducible protein OsmC